MIKDKTLSFKSIKYFEGAEQALIPLIIADFLSQNKKLFFIAKNDTQMAEIENVVSLAQPNAEIISIPAWDTSPYDISSPNKEILGKRISGLTKIFNMNFNQKKVLLLTTMNALFIKNAPKNYYKKLYFEVEKKQVISVNQLKNILIDYGYNRVETVRELSEFSIRGDIVDIFINGYTDPFRVNFLDNLVDKIVKFDPFSQRNIINSDIHKFIIFVSKEYILNEKKIHLFKKKYSENFDLDLKNDFFYNQIMSYIEPSGIENYISLFYNEGLSNIFEFIQNNYTLHNNLTTISYSSIINSLKDRNDKIELNFNNRLNEKEFNFLKPKDIYLSNNHIIKTLETFNTIFFNDNFSQNDINYNFNSKKISLPISLNIAKNSLNNKLIELFKNKIFENKITVIFINDLNKIKNIILHFEPFFKSNNFKFSVLNIRDLIENKIENGFYFCNLYLDYSVEFNNYLFIAEKDIFGNTNRKSSKSKRKADEYLRDLNSLNNNDYIAHVDHGIGQYKILETVNISGFKHDCLKIIYSGGDKLYIPVENIDLLSKVADSNENISLDKLGSSIWQLKKNKIKKKINDIAHKLINTAANRGLEKFDELTEPEDYIQFTKDFRFNLTDDQETAIEDVLNDIYSRRLMDRLICGDVGFGKTEIALRAAYIIASNGKQVALVAPTTILAEQHLNTFKSRFEKYKITVSTLSRMTSSREKSLIKEGLKKGIISIVIGTHALLSKDIGFNDLGMIIIDEEQHFGVSQKERLKELQFNIHVLTLTATPIPRTLQLSLTGLKDLSLITTPPINRLSVRTFIQKWDKLSLTEALLREKNRNGQTFIVCPKIKDLEIVRGLVEEMAPTLSISLAHGSLKVSELERSINSFYNNKTDILISTNIIESGIDIPNANTLIVYNADLFGLSQLYQLRGRVGRSSTRAYAYFTFNKNKILSEKSIERLKVLKTLDNLGAGFTLANYDLDIRGAGNLLGDQQSGQIKEIGYELYQKMLKEAIFTIKKGKKDIIDTWSPSINLGISVLIPEDYVKDLSTRMSLYRKMGDLKNSDEINNFIEELIERFGPLPNEVNNLIFTILLKIKCIKLNIDYVDVGPKAILIGFKNNKFSNPSELIKFISSNQSYIKLRNDQKLIISYNERYISKIKYLKNHINKIEKLI